MAAWTDAARRAESLGDATVLMPDTLRTPAPLPALAAAAAVTSTLRVGTWVLCDALRNPRTLAWEVASLDRLAASVTLLRQLLDRGEDGFPAAAGRVPILIVASGPRLLGYAAQLADIIAFGWPPTTTAERARPLIERVRQAASHRFDDVELATGLIAVGDAMSVGTNGRSKRSTQPLAVLSGVPIVTVGVGDCVLLNGASFVAVVVALATMDTAFLQPTRAAGRGPGQILDGLRYVRRTPRLLIPLLMMLLIGALSDEFEVVLPVLAQRTFHGRANAYGFLIGAFGCGAVVGGLSVAGRRAPGYARS